MARRRRKVLVVFGNLRNAKTGKRVTVRVPREFIAKMKETGRIALRAGKKTLRLIHGENTP